MYFQVHINTIHQLKAGTMFFISNCHIYQNELWVISANLDDGRTGVPPHVIYRPGSRSLKGWRIQFLVWDVKDEGKC